MESNWPWKGAEKCTEDHSKRGIYLIWECPGKGKVRLPGRKERTAVPQVCKITLKSDPVKDMFQINDVNYQVETRNTEKFKVAMAHTERLKKSAIPHMQRL